MAAGDERGEFFGGSRLLGAEDRIEIHTVGVDVGSATSHLAFCRLTAERSGGRYVITEQRLLYESRVALTPYRDPVTIDGEALEAFVLGEYEAAGLTRDAIDTGVVILTGVALRKENARAVGELFADETGRFVSLSAGDRLEAVLAAHGSGAVAESAEGRRVLNVDIGGGTTKFTLCEHGRVRAIAAIEVGARLVVVDDDGVIVRLEEAGRLHAARVGLALSLGSRLDDDERAMLAGEMAESVGAVIDGHFHDVALGELLLTEVPAEWPAPDAICVSGGVGEFFAERETRDFGDLGAFLGGAVREEITVRAIPVHDSAAAIRATVVGASQYTVQVSGATIFVSDPDVLPLRNVPVVAPLLAVGEELPDAEAISSAILERLHLLELDAHDGAIAVVMPWRGSVELARLDSLAAGLTAGLERALGLGQPVLLVWDDDVAGLVGRHLVIDTGVTSPVISVDGIELREFDFVDVGTALEGSGSLPVTIKSLAFPATR